MDETLRRRYERKSAFLDWCDKEGLSVLTGYGIDDLKTAPLKYWERLGGPAAYCHLEGSQGFCRCFDCRDSRQAKVCKSMRHMYEEQVLILRAVAPRSFGAKRVKNRSHWNGSPAVSFRRRSTSNINITTARPASRYASPPQIICR